MKKQLSRALLGLAAALMLTASAGAQVLRGVVVRVPFDFVVGERRMPAGLYTVRRVRSDAETTLVIRGEGGRTAAVVLTNTGAPQPLGAGLVFRQHGDSYFLAEVSMPGAASVRELPKSNAERRLERELAGRNGGDSKTVTVVGSVQ
ncbi:MAG: hypothetical protein JOZ96_00540 [Acidobacteria bacterium]|nr:hypothetical protein [Acidobacteriota bacterium]